MVTLDEYLGIQELARQGLSRSEIARQLGLDRKTVGKYRKEAASPPTSKKRSAGSRKIAPFAAHLRKRLAQGCTDAVVLLREIRELGYQGGYSILKDFLRPLRQDERWRVEIRWEAPPGLYAQVDWGHFTAQLPDGSLLKLYAFVFTLVYSRVMYVEWVLRGERGGGPRLDQTTPLSRGGHEETPGLSPGGLGRGEWIRTTGLSVPNAAR